MGKTLSVYDENRLLKKKNAEYRKTIERLEKKVKQLEEKNKQIGLWT